MYTHSSILGETAICVCTLPLPFAFFIEMCDNIFRKSSFQGSIFNFIVRRIIVAKQNIQKSEQPLVVSQKFQKPLILPPHFSSGETQIPDEVFSIVQNEETIIVQPFISNVPYAAEEYRESRVNKKSRLAPRSR
jgi:hypothetical protein